MKINRVSLILAACLFSFISVGHAAEQYIYKWKDPQGMIHYTERPPAQGVAFEKVRRPTDNGKPSTAAANQKASTDDTAPAKEDKYGGWRKENCKIATQNLDVLENAARIAQDDGQGGKRLMTDEEKSEKINKMTEQKNKYCDPQED